MAFVFIGSTFSDEAFGCDQFAGFKIEDPYQSSQIGSMVLRTDLEIFPCFMPLPFRSYTTFAVTVSTLASTWAEPLRVVQTAYGCAIHLVMPWIAVLCRVGLEQLEDYYVVGTRQSKYHGRVTS